MNRTTPLERRFARDPFVVARRIADEILLVPIRQKAEEVESIYILNQVGARIWELLDGERRGGEIRDVIVEEFEVSPEEVERDLVEFLRQLEQVRVVMEV